MNGFRQTGFNNLPPVVKNLLIINVGLFLFKSFFFSPLNAGGTTELDLWLGLFYFSNDAFYPFQFVTNIFMHGSFMHLALNMLGLYFLGVSLEAIWGSKRFLIFYMATGVGASLFYMAVKILQLQLITGDIWIGAAEALQYGQTYGNAFADIYYSHAIGASGAIYGILMACGMLFPNTTVYLYFAIPVKMKYLVLGAGVIALISGLGNNDGDNVAHFAHLGGMLFGYLLLKYWQKNKGSFY